MILLMHIFQICVEKRGNVKRVPGFAGNNLSDIGKCASASHNVTVYHHLKSNVDIP